MAASLAESLLDLGAHDSADVGRRDLNWWHQEELVETVDNLPTAVLCFLLSFLHGFSLCGPIAIASKSLAGACANGTLCEHALGRDFAQENQLPLPEQPIHYRSQNAAAEMVRFARQHGLYKLSVEDFRNAHTDPGEIARSQLRMLAAALAGHGARHIARVAAVEGRPALLQWAASHADVGNIDEQRRSALMIAALYNRPHTAVAALECCDLEQEHRPHGRAMHMGAFTGAAAALSALCQHGASLESRNYSFQQTPLHVACSRGHVEAVEVLLEARSDHNARDKDGLTPLQIAESQRKEQVVAVLRRHSATQNG